MPAATPWNEFTQLIAFEGPLRVAVKADPAASVDTHTQVMNARVLDCVASLQERRPGTGKDEDNAIAQEIARLDARMDVLLELVGRAVMPESRLPPALPARFNALGLSSPQLPELGPGQRVRVHIHLDACRALPLRLIGRSAAAPDTRFITFDDVGQGLRDALERLVFRHHREHVARARGDRH